MICQLNDFPDEIFCDILIYLSPFDALHAFYNLNQRFNRLLKPFKTQIDLTRLSRRQFDDYFERFLPELNRIQPLETIRLGNRRTPGQIELFNRFLNEKNFREFCGQIRSISIDSARLVELTTFVEKFLLDLPQLNIFRLKIDRIRDEDFQKWTQLIVNSILSMTSIEKLSIEIPNGLVLSRLAENRIFDRLKNIRLNVTLVTDLLLLVPHVSNVETLFIQVTWWTSADRTLVKMLDKTFDNQTNLTRVKRFDLTIKSILTFQFQHFEQLVKRILNEKTSRRLTFVIIDCSNLDESFRQIFRGDRWEMFLSNFTSLNRFDVFIRLSESVDPIEAKENLQSFDRLYFRQRQWKFSHWTTINPNRYVFFSIPYRQNQKFELILGDDRPSQILEKNFASTLSIDQSSNEMCPLNNLTFHWIFEQFPLVKKLKLIRFQMNFSSSTPLNLPSLQRLEIEKERNISLEHLLHLFPFVTRLSLSFSTIFHQNFSTKFFHFGRIVDLTVSGIPAESLQQTFEFFGQFPNLNSFQVQIQNRRIDDEHLLELLMTIVNRFDHLIYFQLQLEKNLDESIDVRQKLSEKIQMFFIEQIFDGFLFNFWF